MKNLKTSLILGGSLLLSTASFTPVFAESVKTESNNQTTITQQVKSDNSESYLIVPVKKSINEAVVVPLKQYIALGSTKGLENPLVVKGTSVKTFGNHLAQFKAPKVGAPGRTTGGMTR